MAKHLNWTSSRYAAAVAIRENAGLTGTRNMVAALHNAAPAPSMSTAWQCARRHAGLGTVGKQITH